MGIKLAPEAPAEVKFSDVYGVEFDNFGVIRKSKLGIAPSCILCDEYEVSHCSFVDCFFILRFFIVLIPYAYCYLPLKQMYRFTVYSFQRSKSQPAQWVLTTFTFGHEDQQTCQMWVNQIDASLVLQDGRPKNLLVSYGNHKPISILFVMGYLLHLKFELLVMSIKRTAS